MPRPLRVLTEKELKTAMRAAGYGLTTTAIANLLDISPSAFDRIIARDDRAIGVLLEKGRAKAEHLIANALFRKAIKGDLGAIVWWEKTRAGRHERQEVILTDEQRQARVAELLARGEGRLKLA